jgi:hypothetical protein
MPEPCRPRFPSRIEDGRGRIPIGPRAAFALAFAIAGAAFIPGAIHAASATDHTAAGPAKVVLPPDPAILTALDTLPPGASAWLPPVRTAGRINAEQRTFGMDRTGPRPRNYSLKWVWAEDRGRALYAGANHSAPHRLNDVWEYDLPSNTWIGLWEPDPDLHKASPEAISAVFELHEGIPMTRRGAPFDPVHTWWALAYDTERQELVWDVGHFNKVRWAYPGFKDWRSQYLWTYSPAGNKWSFVHTKNPLRQTNADMLEYIPSLGGLVYYSNNWAMRGMHVLERGAGLPVWRDLRPNGGADFRNPDFPQPEAVGCWLAPSGPWLVQSHYVTHRYDLQSNTWSHILEGREGSAPNGMDNRAAMVCDPLARRAYVIEADSSDPAGRRGLLWSYDSLTGSWAALRPRGPAPEWGLAYFDPRHRVLLVQGKGKRPWVYRPEPRNK